MTRYVIADALLFDDEVYEISTPDCPDNSVMLGAAASRCFSTLLEARGAIVTKKNSCMRGGNVMVSKYQPTVLINRLHKYDGVYPASVIRIMS